MIQSSGARRHWAGAWRSVVIIGASGSALFAASPQQDPLVGHGRIVAPLDDPRSDAGASIGPRAAAEPSLSARPCALAVSPAEEFRIGPENDFEPEALHRTYSLENRGADVLGWEARASQPWLSFAGPASGTLAPGEAVEVQVDVDPFTAARSGEDALGVVSFVDVASSASVTADVRVTESFSLPISGSGGPAPSGWTRFQASPDTRRVFVSAATGNDQNDGLSPGTAKRTLAAGMGLLRHGFPDWLLLERGAVWHESLGQWKKSGRSASEPMVVSTYGYATARPLLETGTLGGIWTNAAGGSPATIDNLAVVGVHFHADGYTGGGNQVGALMLQPASHVLFEDCMFQGYSLNLVFQGFGGRHTDFKLRRSVIVDAYTIHAIGGHSQGLYAYAVDGLLLEENVFDHNGWHDTIPGAGADIYSHNIYIDNDNTGVVVRGNLIANASSHGMQLRPGGTAMNNVFVRNSIALSVGGGNNPELAGVTANVVGNAIIDGKDIDAVTPRGWGMWFANISAGRVYRNLIANNVLGTQPNAMMLAGRFLGDTHPSIGVHNLAIEGNVLYNWAGSIRIDGDSWQVSNVKFAHNDVQSSNSPDMLIDQLVPSSLSGMQSASNRFFSALAPSTAWTMIGSLPHPLSYWCGQVGDTSSQVQQVGYNAPSRTAATYNASLGGTASLAAYLSEARRQSSKFWRSEYSAVALAGYLRQGF